MKNIKSYLLMFILGGICFSGIGAFAEYIVTADKIEYATNVSVKDKIDDLYSIKNVIINNLNNQISLLQSTASNNEDTILEQQQAIASLNAQLQTASNVTASGNFTTTNATTTHTINTGFRPSKVLFIIPSANAGFYEFWVYDESKSASNIEGSWVTLNSSGDSCKAGYAIHNKSVFGFDVTNTGFTYKAPGDNDKGKTYWYAIK